MNSFDLIVIGSGPGGYTGAIRAAQLGLKIAVVEKEKTFGGTCLNVGCIPSKALLDSSEHFHDAQHSLATHGVDLSGIKLNLATMLKRKNKIVSELTGGIQYLFKKNKIESIAGTGKLLSAKQVEVTDATGEKKVFEAKNIMLATGSEAASIPTIPFDGKTIVSSTEALAFTEVPKHLIVIGGGVIGLELGSVWRRLGAKVSVLEFQDQLCGAMDTELSKQLHRILKAQGFEFYLDTMVQSAQSDGKQVKLAAENKNTKEKLELSGDKVLVCVGRRPYSENLGLKEAGVKQNERGFVEVDSHLQTSVPGVYAIGDLVPGPMLAHKAEEEGVAVAETIVNGSGHVNYETVPAVVYTWPEVASVGKTEEELKQAGLSYNKGKFPFSANGRAKAMGSTDGFVKVLADKSSDRILGVHIIGPRASDMIAEAVAHMEYGGSSEDLARAFHAHPALTEVLREAALGVNGNTRQM